MKRALLTILCVFFALSSPRLHGNVKDFTANDSHKDEYSWTLTDENQKKQAIGMYAWGLFFTIVIAIVANTVPNSPSANPTTNGTSSSSSSSGITS